MSTIELKNKLKEKIEELNEDYILEHLLSIIEVETSDKVLEIPEIHKKSIDISLAQIKEGNTFSNQDVMKRVQEWADK